MLLLRTIDWTIVIIKVISKELSLRFLILLLIVYIWLLIKLSCLLLPARLRIRCLRMLHVRVLLSWYWWRFMFHIRWWLAERIKEHITKSVWLRPRSISLVCIDFRRLITKNALDTLECIKESLIVGIIIKISFAWHPLWCWNCWMWLHLLSLLYYNGLWLSLYLSNRFLLRCLLQFLLNLLSIWQIVSGLSVLHLLLFNMWLLLLWLIQTRCLLLLLNYMLMWCLLYFLLFFCVPKHYGWLLLLLLLRRMSLSRRRLFIFSRNIILLIERLLVMNLFLLLLIWSILILLLLWTLNILSTAVIWLLLLWRLLCFPLGRGIFHLRLLRLLHRMHHRWLLTTLIRWELGVAHIVSSSWRTLINLHFFVSFILLTHPIIKVLLLLVWSSTRISIVYHIWVICRWHRSSLTASRFTIIIMVIRGWELGLGWVHLLSVSVHIVHLMLILLKSIWCLIFIMMMMVIFLTILVAVFIELIHFIFLAILILVIAATATSSIIRFRSIVPVIFFTSQAAIGLRR